MKQKMKQKMIRWFRYVGMIEGLSLIALVGIAMPLKYGAGMDEVVSVVGMIHGVLYVLYMGIVAMNTLYVRWSWKWVLVATALAFIPFGFMMIDRKLKQMEASLSIA